MPLSSIAFDRSPDLKDKVGTVQLPDYSVLFYYGKSIDWVNTPSGTLNKDYFCTLTSKTNNFITLGMNSGPTINWPIVSCVSDYSKANTTIFFQDMFVSADLVSLGTLLDIGGTHNPILTNFRSAGTPLAFAFNTGDTVSATATDTYIMQTGTHFGHQHYTEGSDLIKALNNKSNASGDVPSESLGIPQLAVNAVLKDPSILGKSTVMGWLPKNVIVFGSDLPSQYYSRTDPLNTGNKSFNNVPSRGTDNLSNTWYITCYNTAYGTFFNPTTNITITSNTYPDHTHNVVPVINSKKSKITGQKASIETAAGAHNHPVTYNLSAYVQGKKLKAWITTNDKTPIANGVIIAYAPSAAMGYNFVDTSVSVQSTLPAGWFVCDGNNGTPDLRNYFAGANFNDSDHDVDITGVNPNSMSINSITVTANGAHSHVTPGNLNITGPVGTPKDIGSHLLEPSTAHTHVIATNASFRNSAGITRGNINAGSYFGFTPPTLVLNYIMYNENQITGSYDVSTPPPPSGDDDTPAWA